MKSIWRQGKILLQTALRVQLPLLAFFVTLFLIARRTGIPFFHFTGDVAGITHTPFYLGVASNVGVLLWCAAASVSLFTAYELRSEEPEKSKFLFWAGMFTLLLLLDDLFMFHDRILPDHLHLADDWFYAAYAGFLVFLLGRYRRVILEADYMILVFALAWLGLSVLIDLIPGPVIQRRFIEDGSKLLGIGTWLAFFVRICHRGLP
jgi:hypothetical protein